MGELSPEMVATVGAGGVTAAGAFFVLLWRLVGVLSRIQIAVTKFVDESTALVVEVKKTLRRQRAHLIREEAHHKAQQEHYKAQQEHQRRVEDLLERIDQQGRTGVPRALPADQTGPIRQPGAPEPRWEQQGR